VQSWIPAIPAGMAMIQVVGMTKTLTEGAKKQLMPMPVLHRKL